MVSVIDEILPHPVVTVETREILVDIELFPPEAAAVARAVDKRKHEFTTVRACAREALAKLGRPAVPILPGLRGAPGWPDGIVGSMTHCDGYRAAALAERTDVTTIGIDAEPHAALPEGVFGVISLPSERATVAELTAADPSVHWDRLLFCAKESVYKAWFPLTERFLNFEEAAIELRRGGTFTAKILVEGPPNGFEGRWLVSDGILLTTIAVPA